jgi:uncharacterized membrane protein YGL010W
MTVDLKDTTKLNKFQKYFYDYGCYHNNIINIIIHVICVPIIVFTLGKISEHYVVHVAGLAYNYPFYALIGIIVPNWIYVDPILGTLTSIQYIGTSLLTEGLDFSYGKYSSIQVLALVHIVAWIAQFIGHGAFEKRKPALMDNIVLTANAPYFVNLELAYFTFGYGKTQIDEAKNYVRKNIVEYRKANNIKIN